MRIFISVWLYLTLAVASTPIPIKNDARDSNVIQTTGLATSIEISRQKRQFPPQSFGNGFGSNNGVNFDGFQGNGQFNPNGQNFGRPIDEEWFIFDQSRPTRPNPQPIPPSRPTTSTPQVPGSATRRSLCEELCRITPQYNPVCGSNNMTYSNEARFRCAQDCGKPIQLLHMGACTRRL